MESTVTLRERPAEADESSHGSLYARRFRTPLLYAVTLTALPLAALLAVPVALANLLVFRSPSQVLFIQERAGLHGRRFRLLKFRTMTNARGFSGALLPDAQRLTPFGRWLRATSIDELPELINILRGEMSVVGPRPIVEQEIPRYGPAMDHVLRVRPGLTGLWQVSGRNNVSYQRRVLLDLNYVKRGSLRLDLFIVLRTVMVLLFHGNRGAY